MRLCHAGHQPSDRNWQIPEIWRIAEIRGRRENVHFQRGGTCPMRRGQKTFIFRGLALWGGGGNFVGGGLTHLHTMAVMWLVSGLCGFTFFNTVTWKWIMWKVIGEMLGSSLKTNHKSWIFRRNFLASRYLKFKTEKCSIGNASAQTVFGVYHSKVPSTVYPKAVSNLLREII